MVRTQEKAVRRETLRITEQIKAENTLEWTGQLNNNTGVCERDSGERQI